MSERRRRRAWPRVATVGATAALAACTQSPGPTTPPPTGPVTTAAPTTTRPPSGGGASAGRLWNVSGDIGVHDPTIIHEGNDWYVFSTGQGIQVLRSTDGGQRWARAPQIYLNNSLPAWWKRTVPGQKTNDVWAPDVNVYNGKVWLYYAISTFGSRNSAIGLTRADRVAAGHWEDQGEVLHTTDRDDYNAIDPNLVIDAAGQPWLAFGSFWDGLKLTPLDRSSMKPKQPLKLTSLAKRSNGIEAPSIIYRNGWYYLFASIDKCCQGVNSTYKIVFGRSQQITGPYVDRSGRRLLDGGGTVLDAGNGRWKGPGGQDVDPSGVLARHAYDATDNGNPKLLVNTLGWTADGWPTY